jgi:hypothetical protein
VANNSTSLPEGYAEPLRQAGVKTTHDECPLLRQPRSSGRSALGAVAWKDVLTPADRSRMMIKPERERDAAIGAPWVCPSA